MGFGIAALGALKLAAALPQDASHTWAFVMAAATCFVALGSIALKPGKAA